MKRDRLNDAEMAELEAFSRSGRYGAPTDEVAIALREIRRLRAEVEHLRSEASTTGNRSIFPDPGA